MKKWRTKSGVEIVQVLNGRSNAYLIVTENENALIDTGKESTFSRLQKNIEALKLPRKNIDLLILTHTHFDHCQNAFALRKQFSCIIVMSENEAEYAEQGFTPLPKGTFPLTNFISKLGNLIGKGRFGYKPFVPDRLVSCEVNLEAFKITLIPTPGHSIGCISIIVDNEIALVGDTLFGVFAKSVFPPFADDVDGMIASWGRLLETNCDTFLPGHGKEIKRDLVQREFEKYSQKSG
jgi:glyoxylase-like metal-dependent hydrolase (beta-lactamase superfamily II)